ncbi:MAG TPA: phage tail assembly chaperone [Steroidobacter sp.]|uniref:phage tail assembly chaperone n=1 Tax=Steroidobacter sp. TaxID=1978227 RepID=UPI002ED7B6FE
MTEVRLQPEPTFEAPVKIHVPGKGELEMNWTFRYRNAEEVLKFQRKWTGGEGSRKKTDDFDSIGYIMDMAAGWELTEEFNKKNVETFFRNYPTSATKVVSTYFEELAGARRKN